MNETIRILLWLMVLIIVFIIAKIIMYKCTKEVIEETNKVLMECDVKDSKGERK